MSPAGPGDIGKRSFRQVVHRVHRSGDVALVFWDVETYSHRDLKETGAFNYAADPTTGLHFFCYAVDDGDVQTWRPGDPVPAPFADPAGYIFVSDNWTFERLILTHVLIPRHGFTPIPLEQQDCAQRRA